MNRYEQAVAYHHKGFNCCQSVLAAYSDLTGLSQQASFDMGGGFGAGAQTGELCGAITGAILTLGMLTRWTPGPCGQQAPHRRPGQGIPEALPGEVRGPAMQAPAEGRDPGHRRHPRGPGIWPSPTAATCSSSPPWRSWRRCEGRMLKPREGLPCLLSICMFTRNTAC